MTHLEVKTDQIASDIALPMKKRFIRALGSLRMYLNMGFVQYYFSTIKKKNPEFGSTSKQRVSKKGLWVSF